MTKKELEQRLEQSEEARKALQEMRVGMTAQLKEMVAQRNHAVDAFRATRVLLTALIGSSVTVTIEEKFSKKLVNVVHRERLEALAHLIKFETVLASDQ